MAARNKSTPIIALGAAVFVVGAALLFLLLRNDNSSKPRPLAKSGAAAATTTTAATGGVTFSAAPPTTAIQFKIPDGQQALSVQMDYFGGGGGFVRAGDTVDVYAIINKDCKDPKTFPLAVKLVEPNIKVLEVIGQPAGQTGQATNFLLSVTPQQAEQLIFLKSGFSLYFTLSTPNQPAPATTGITCTNGI